MRKFNLILFLLTVVVCLNSCGNSGNSERSSTDTTKSAIDRLELKPLTHEITSSQFHLYFDIRRISETDSSVLYEAISEFSDEPVGFDVEVLKNIQPGIELDGEPNKEMGFKEGAIHITSNGTNSDNFVRALGVLFKLPVDGKMTKETLSPMVFSSNRDMVDLSASGTYNFRYFFDNNTGREAELIGVVDTFKYSFELYEVDSTFRAAIISAFEGK